MNIKRIFLSFAVLVFAGAVVVGGTGAFFSDEERSSGNTFTSGTIDLKVDSESHYNNMVCSNEGTPEDPDYQWVEEDNFVAGASHYPAPGSPCDGTWALTDLGPTHTFFNFSDLKPGDHGENTISLHVYDNDAWACAIIDNMMDEEVGECSEPESALDATCADGDEGELSPELDFFAWEESDGDNIWEPVVDDPTVEPVLFSNEDGPASDVIDGRSYPFYTPDRNGGAVMDGDTTTYIGLYWCYGDITINPAGVTFEDRLKCDGASVTSASQSDELTADFTFYVEQARNNPNFTCPDPRVGEPVGADIMAYVAPDTQTCNITVPTNYATVQGAVDAASTGDTICVDTGTYVENVTVDEDVTILGLNDPTGGSKATIEGRLDFVVDGITMSGLEVTNPDAGYGVVLSGVNSSEISNSVFTSIGTNLDNGSAQAIYFDGGANPASGLAIHDNVIDGVGNLTLGYIPGNSSAKGIFIGDSASVATLSGLTIEDNEIRNIFASTAPWNTSSFGGAGATGILLNHGYNAGGVVTGALIKNNTIENAEGLWGRGIGLEGPTPNAVISHNDVSNLAEHKGGTDAWAVLIEGNPDVGTVSINFNNFASNMVGGVKNTIIATQVDAENNWWGDTDPTDDFGGLVDYEPFELSAFPVN